MYSYVPTSSSRSRFPSPPRAVFVVNTPPVIYGFASPTPNPPTPHPTPTMKTNKSMFELNGGERVTITHTKTGTGIVIVIECIANGYLHRNTFTNKFMPSGVTDFELYYDYIIRAHSRGEVVPVMELATGNIDLHIYKNGVHLFSNKLFRK